MKYQKIISFTIVCFVFSCSTVKKTTSNSNNNRESIMAKFEPKDGECLFFDTDLSKPNVAKEAWESWFVPFFNTLNQNKDVIKAFAYINVDWSVQPMWINNDLFKHVDSRIQESAFISKKWKEEISKPRYLKPSAALWAHLEYKR